VLLAGEALPAVGAEDHDGRRGGWSAEPLRVRLSQSSTASWSLCKALATCCKSVVWGSERRPPKESEGLGLAGCLERRGLSSLGNDRRERWREDRRGSRKGKEWSRRQGQASGVPKRLQVNSTTRVGEGTAPRHIVYKWETVQLSYISGVFRVQSSHVEGPLCSRTVAEAAPVLE